MRIMRRWFPIIAAVLAVSFPVSAAQDVALQGMIDRAGTAPVGDRPALYVDIAERQLKAADDLYTEGKADEAHAAVKDVVVYSEKARDTAIQSGRKLKTTEISIRRMAAKLRDIKRTLSFEDQGPVQAAADRLETMRTDLQHKMFGKGK